VPGQRYDAQGFINNRWKVSADYYGSVPRVRGVVHSEIIDYLESEWDGSAGEVFLKKMDNYGRYRSDEPGGLSREAWEEARDSLLTFLAAQGDLPDAIEQLYELMTGTADEDELEADQAHGRPGAFIGENRGPGASQPLRQGTDQAPGDDDEEDVDEYAEELDRGAANPTRSRIEAIAKASAKGAMLGLRALRGVGGFVAQGILGSAQLFGDVASDMYKFSEGEYGGPPQAAEASTSNGVMDMIGSLGSSFSQPAEAPMPAARARAAKPRESAFPGAVNGNAGMPPPLPASALVGIPSGAAGAAAAAAAPPPAPAPPRRAARIAERSPEQVAAFMLAQSKSETNATRTGRGRPDIHNMARLAELYESETGKQLDKSSFNEDGSFADPHAREWFKKAMKGADEESKKIRQHKNEIDEKYNMKGGMRGEMNGCGKPSIECCTDSEDEPPSAGMKRGRGRFPKGSEEARAYMASIRAKRKPKTQ
jgi:hypothetical protein